MSSKFQLAARSILQLAKSTISDHLTLPNMSVIAFWGFGGLCAIYGGWEWFEPILGFATLGTASAAWLQTQKAKKAVYADNGDGEWIVAVQVGRPVSEAVKQQFGSLDVLVDVNSIIGDATFRFPSHYEKMAKVIYAGLVQGQGKNIRLVLSGPLALSFLVGQMTGLGHFNMEVFQWDASIGKYAPVPRPNRDWLEHREQPVVD